MSLPSTTGSPSMEGAAVADDGSAIKPGISSGEGQCLSETKKPEAVSRLHKSTGLPQGI